MITERQEKLLDFVIREFIRTTEPISSKTLKEAIDLSVCGATIRNDLQSLTKQGYIEQPHTSAGRVPTKKAYKYFADKVACEETFQNFIYQEIKNARKQIDEELRLVEELVKSLSETSSFLEITRISDKDNLFEVLSVIGPARTIYQKNINIINSILKELENL